MTGHRGFLLGAAEVLLTLLLTSMLLGAEIYATHLSTADPGTSRIPTKPDRPSSPHRFRLDGKSTSLSPTTTSEPSSFAYFYKKDADLGTDPSTWKLLPIQIPDDLVSGANIQEEVTLSSMVPPYPTPVTPQFGRHPGIAEPTPYPYERIHLGTANGQESTESQRLSWNSHDSKSDQRNPEKQLHDKGLSHGRPEPQEQAWEQHDSEGYHKDHDSVQETWDHHDKKSHESNEAQQENWDHHDKMSQMEPEPQQETWGQHDTASSHSRIHEPQQHNWGSHGTEHSKDSPASHPNWDHHYSYGDHENAEVHHWDSHDTEPNHGTLEQEYAWEHHQTNNYIPQKENSWNYNGIKTRIDQPSSSTEHYYNWTHTADGYEIKNFYEKDQFTEGSHASIQNLDQPQHLMPYRPMGWNWKPPDTPSWHQNIVQRIGQHFPKLPALPKLRLPGLGSFPRLPKLPNWLVGGQNRRVHDQKPEEVEGDYLHKFYPLVPENNPLQHLASNLDRHHMPHYKYPPRQDLNAQNTLDFDHHTDNAHEPNSHYAAGHSGDNNLHTDNVHEPYSHYPAGHSGDSNPHTDGNYMPQRFTRPQHRYTQNQGHHTTRKEAQMGHQKQHAGQETPHYTKQTRHPRPTHSHSGPQRILKVPHRQAYEGYLEKHHSQHNRHNWAWDTDEKETTQSYPPQRDPLNRYPSPLHNWLPQGPTRPSNGYASPNRTRHGQYYHPQAHTAPPQRPYNPTPSQGYPQHQYQQQQQQESSSSWFSAGHHQHKPDVYDNNILDPLSSLLSRPSPFSIFDTSPYQQSIMDRLTGVSTSDTATTLSIPGGLLVLGLALALFYFNFVWYPTPVVTAKLFKTLSDNTPVSSLSEGQQQAVGELYQVFRSLEKEYKHDPSASSAPCRSRLVCQVHQELPGLWSVTQAYVALVKSSFTSGSDEDNGFSGYQTAAQRGAYGEDCASYYKECALPIAPVKATLKKLLTLLLKA